MKKESIFMDKYHALFTDPTVMENHHSYYTGLITFIKTNYKFFSRKLLVEQHLDIFMELNPQDYVRSYPRLSLEREKEKQKAIFKKLPHLAQSIQHTLWELVAEYSGKECPIIDQYDMRYILMKYEDGTERILEECEQCGYLTDSLGQPYKGPIGKIVPVSKQELADFLAEKEL